MEKKYRLLTKSNLDGIIAAILLENIGLIEDVIFVNPQDFQKGKVVTSQEDITVNLPYARGVHQAFDYHDSSTVPNLIINEHHVFDTTLQSASAVIFSHYHDRLKSDLALEALVQLATKETNHTLTTKERLTVYAQYESIFDKQLLEA